jgi:hypothetical protein
MARFDKYDGKTGGFRAPLAAAIAIGDVGKIQAVSIDSSGRAAIGGAAQTAISGLICPVRPMEAGEAIDVMTRGEIEEATETAGTAFTLGLPVFAHADGTVDDTSTNGVAVGITVTRLTRLVVHCSPATT